jgi:DNA modification methylase
VVTFSTMATPTDPCSYQVLLANEKARQIVTDPPYNVPISRHVSSARGFREFQQASGEISQQGFTTFLARFLELATANARDGAVLHVFMDWRHLPELLTASQTVGLTNKNICVWAKSSAGMGSFYRSQHELIVVLKAGTAPHINNFGLGQHGRYRSNVWTYPAVRGPRRGVNSPQGGHPTVKPVSMIIDAIKDCSNRGDLVLDPFGGSGTTLIAAERTRRRARLIELDSHYCDLTIRRFELLTGQVARLAGNGRSFAEIAAERSFAEIAAERSSEAGSESCSKGEVDVQE